MYIYMLSVQMTGFRVNLNYSVILTVLIKYNGGLEEFIKAALGNLERFLRQLKTRIFLNC